MEEEVQNNAAEGTPLSNESSLSNYVGPYVTDMLGRGQALSETPYEAYTGPLTAGASNLQETAFGGIGDLNIPTDTMGAFTPQGFDATTAQGLMNPYLMSALQPQIDEARRQSEISRVNNASRLTQAGAYGGGRQAIMDSENQRNLLQNLAGITGTGYRDAYDKAMGQFNVEQDRGMAAQRDTNRFGLDALGAQMGAGQVQRGIEQQGISADRLQFGEEQMDPFKKVQYMQSLLDGLPLATQSYTYAQPTALETLQQDTGDVMSLVTSIFGKNNLFGG